ncbi:MAG: glycoside hydrolase family 127 protein, partial [Planctomycetes bacterium]|nr:glycoside hydrolase family 127 protein [Planctomycetota bacterium]
DVYVNLFISGESTIETLNNKVKLTQQTQYPWKGIVHVSIEPEKSDTFAVYIRIPGWAQNRPVPSDLYKFQKTRYEEVTLKVNGKRVAIKTQRGFARIERKWQKGDTIELNLPMPIRRVIAHQNIKANRGKVALQRGPIVFCLEWPDNDGKVLNLMIPDASGLMTEYRPDLLNGVMVVTGKAQVVKRTNKGDIVPAQEKQFIAIPYYAWAHRGRGEMTVWPARKAEAARPEPADTLTYRSKTTASFVHASLDAIKDQVLPESSSDSSALQLDFWPHKGTTEWIKFEWNEKHKISGVKVYWFDDTGRGQCSVPKSWKVLYRDTKGNFKPAKNSSPYLTVKNTFNEVIFEPVKTNSIKIEIMLQNGRSAGVQEVIIK